MSPDGEPKSSVFVDTHHVVVFFREHTGRRRARLGTLAVLVDALFFLAEQHPWRAFSTCFGDAAIEIQWSGIGFAETKRAEKNVLGADSVRPDNWVFVGDGKGCDKYSSNIIIIGFDLTE